MQVNHDNIALTLPAAKNAHGTHLAVVVQIEREYQEMTFSALDARCDQIAHGLVSAGLGAGQRCVLMVTPSFDFFAITFALFKMGVIPVLIDPGMGVKHLKTCIATSKATAFIGVPKAHIARILFGWGKGRFKQLITVGPKLWGGTTLAKIITKTEKPFPVYASTYKETAAILFTSGSTGTPKGVVYSHSMFNAQIAALKSVYGITPGERDLATFPLFALFSPALGMTAVIPDMDASKPGTADPNNLITAIQKYGCTNMFGSPALLDVLSKHYIHQKQQHIEVALPTLKRVISAGAPANLPSLKQFIKILNSDVEVLTSYGATESLPVSFIGTKELLADTQSATDQGAGICVGRPLDSVDVQIIAVVDEAIDLWDDVLVLPNKEIGEICVKGVVASPCYYDNEIATKLAKIKTGDNYFYHRMGDVGYLDDIGRLWMCGRKTHRIECETETLYTIPCERIFNTHKMIRRTALVPVRRDKHFSPVLCVELNAPSNIAKNDIIREELRELGRQYEMTASIDTILFHKAFPVDIRHNAKIFREKLAVWASDKINGPGG